MQTAHALTVTERKQRRFISNTEFAGMRLASALNRLTPSSAPRVTSPADVQHDSRGTAYVVRGTRVCVHVEPPNSADHPDASGPVHGICLACVAPYHMRSR